MTSPPGGTGHWPLSSEPTGTSGSGSTASTPVEPGEHRRRQVVPPFNKTALWATGVASAVLLTVLLGLWLSNRGLNNRVDRLEGASTSRGEALVVLCQQVKAAGGTCAVDTPAPGSPEEPVPAPTVVPVPPVDYDRVVREAVAQVRSMVHDGAPGKAGPAPTPAQIDAAVARVCAAACGPSQGAITDAVAAYFAVSPPPSGPPGEPGATGPVGPTGEPGPSGSPGRGIARTEVSDCQLTVTYTDGTTDGPFDVCQPSPTPTPASSSPAAPAPSPLVRLPG